MDNQQKKEKEKSANSKGQKHRHPREPQAGGGVSGETRSEQKQITFSDYLKAHIAFPIFSFLGLEWATSEGFFRAKKAPYIPHICPTMGCPTKGIPAP